MTFLFYHLLISFFVASVFGVLIDLDHSGVNKESVKCALSVRDEDCLKVGGRGLFHRLYVWKLSVLAVICYTVHLIIDGEIY